MTDCASLNEFLVDLASADDESVPPGLEQHLALCEACARQVDDVRAVRLMVHDALDLELTEADQAELDAMVLAAIARQG